ncbi:MAG: AAA family ATPase [Bacteroidales bacterium]|nr:AAA family ATPase [Bacteroidales bacterium]
MAISLDDLSRKLPIGVQSFEKLIESKCLYVDKTDYVYFLANSGTTSYFLARPRRFGKSLFANTLRAYFEGKKELFEGLKIYSYEKSWTKYPLAYFDFVDGDYSSPSTLITSIRIVLREFEIENGIQFDESFIKDEIEKDDDKSEGKKLSYRFKYDMRVVSEKTGLKTVIIVDEYDNPLITSENLTESKKIYRGFFSVLKAADKNIRFAFITGVTKFAKTSIFSGANQPEDITDDERFSAICGITHEELTDNFTPEIEKFAKKKNLTFAGCIAELKRWYDCYLFHEEGENVFNPVSLFNALNKRDFQNYWYETGNPTILMKRIHSGYYDFRHLVNDVSYPKDGLKSYKDDDLNTDLIPLLYYTGYLTIKKYDEKSRLYTLGFPNNEIELSFLNGLADEFYRAPNSVMGFNYGDFLSDFYSGDVESLIGRFQTLYSAIPYANDDNDKWVERDFQNVIFLVFTICGHFVVSELHSSKGRADTIVINDKFVYLFDFKIDSDAQTELDQINEKDYAGRFKMDNRKLFKIGVNFSSKEKNITDWKVAE